MYKYKIQDVCVDTGLIRVLINIIMYNVYYFINKLICMCNNKINVYKMKCINVMYIYKTKYMHNRIRIVIKI